MILYAVIPDGGVVPAVPDQGSAVMEVRNLIMERVGETGLATDEKLRSLVRRANRKVWNRAIKKNSVPWQTRTGEMEYDAAAGKFSLDIFGGLSAEDAADLPFTFGGVRIHKVCYLEVFYLTGWYPVPENAGSERWQTEPGMPLMATAPRLPAFFYIEGNDLYFSYPPATNLRFRAVVVPSLPDPADGEQLLQGRFPEHHDLVVTEAARLAYATDGRTSTPWDKERDELMGDFVMALSKGQGNRTLRIGARGPYSG